jgi:hypothetical protein
MRYVLPATTGKLTAARTVPDGLIARVTWVSDPTASPV